MRNVGKFRKLNIVEKMHRSISQKLLKVETRPKWVGPIFDFQDMGPYRPTGESGCGDLALDLLLPSPMRNTSSTAPPYRRKICVMAIVLTNFHMRMSTDKQARTHDYAHTTTYIASAH